MKNKVLLFALLLSFATSCIFDDTNSPVEEAGDTYLSLKSSQIMLPSDQTGVNMESITIESLRIMVFSKATGQVVTNKVFDIANLNLATKDPVSGYWIIDFSNIVVATKPGPSIVYVVLNENIMSISGQTLTGALNAIPNITGMKTLVDTPLSYTHPLRVVYDTDEKPIEPPFIMSTFDEFVIPIRTISNPYVADLRGPSETKKGFELDRTMAKVTLDSISSYPRNTGETTDNKQTSYIFILKVGLVNVPTQYLWSPNRLQTTPPANPTYTVPVPPYTGSFQTLDFGLEDPILGYYDRDWNGNIVLNIDANAYEVQELKDSRIWYTGLGSGSNAYTLNKYALDANIASNPNNINKWCFQSEYSDTDGDGIVNPSPIDLNAGNFLTMVQALYSNPDPNAYLPTWYELKEPYTITPTITGAYWSLKEKNISYYVPEHVLTNKADKTNATQLHVKAAKASIQNTITKEESTQITWNSTNWGQWVYAIAPGSNSFGNITGNEFTQMMRGLWGAELATITVGTKTYHIVRHYWKGGIRYRDGHATGTLDGGKFQNITNSADIKDFYLPIGNFNSNPVDYNIYRNHEYKFSVHALEQWTPTVRNAVSGTANNGNDTTGSMVLRFNDH